MNCADPGIERYLILDRDGVINSDSPAYIKSPDEFVPIPGSLEAIARLSQTGFKIVIATNQSGLARDLFDEFTLAQIHSKLCSMVEELGGYIDGIFYCPHSPDAGCLCRKPATGLLTRIEQEMHCSLKGCFFIGDSEKDLQSATTYGCSPVLVLTGNGKATYEALSDSDRASIPVFSDLNQAIERLFFTRED